IVAVHGVNGHRSESWTNRDEATGTTLWLSDVLLERIPSSRVMTFGYSSNPSVGDLIHASALRRAARDLLQQLHAKRALDQNVPLVFIGHNLGGVVVK
ncbi:hypothetical protein K440DRAFT_501231, partial [Wilcoxina mikolae CBS 423.85]